MTRLHRICGAVLLLAAIPAAARTLNAQRTGAPEVLLRLDDVGMNHSVNLAVEKVAATGMPFSVSVLFACPWYQEAVEILKKHPRVTVGVHLALNSEWRNYRWGPVLGKGGVPSLVDSVGYFLPSRDAFLASKYDLAEVERELTAQVERALASGLRITYVDAHMGMAEATPQLRAVEERVAKTYGLAISTYFGESYFSLWGVPVASKKATLLAHLADAKRDSVNLIEVHVAERTPEMEVIFDMNAPSQNTPDAGVVAHRKAELETMLSPDLAELVRSGKIQLVTYQQLVARSGLAGMRRPQTLRMPRAGTEEQLRADAAAEGAAFTRVSNTNTADAAAPRVCVDAFDMGPARSGEFTIGGNLSGMSGMRAGHAAKVWWAPLHHARNMPPLLVRGRSLTTGDTVRFTSATVAWPVVPGAPPVPEAERKYFFPSGITIPRPGSWLLIATSGANWGCFVLTAR